MSKNFDASSSPSPFAIAQTERSASSADTSDLHIRLSDKYCLTIKEAAKYFGIGEKKLRQLVAENMNHGFAIQNGVKILIKRTQMEAFLNDISSI